MNAPKWTKWQDKQIETSIGDMRQWSNETVISYSILNSSNQPVEIVPPQIQITGRQATKKKKKEGKGIISDQLEIRDYRLSTTRLEPGERADGVVVFDRPNFKESTEKLFLANRAGRPGRSSHPDPAAVHPTHLRRWQVERSMRGYECHRQQQEWKRRLADVSRWNPAEPMASKRRLDAWIVNSNQEPAPKFATRADVKGVGRNQQEQTHSSWRRTGRCGSLLCLHGYRRQIAEEAGSGQAGSVSASQTGADDSAPKAA